MRILIASATLTTGALAVAGCGESSRAASRAASDSSGGVAVERVVPSQWPNAADYQTIKVAVSVRDRALLEEPDWRRKAGLARIAILTLMTLRGHFLAGTCATFVNGLYDELLSLADGYQGEDWRPLIAWVRQHPTFESSCRPPPGQRPGL